MMQSTPAWAKVLSFNKLIVALNAWTGLLFLNCQNIKLMLTNKLQYLQPEATVY